MRTVYLFVLAASACLPGVALAQTSVDVSGFADNNVIAGCVNLSAINGTWPLSQTGAGTWSSVKPGVTITPDYIGHPPGAMLTVHRIAAGTVVTVHYNSASGYKPAFFLGHAGPGILGTAKTVPRNDADARTMVVR